jgi:hypothetical protein
MTPSTSLQQRLAALENHLRAENPNLLPVIPTFRSFDQVLYRLGLLTPSDSLTTRIPWWPMIAVLGTFSAGKSTFVNTYLGTQLQTTGNQAIDDKFTVVCLGGQTKYEALPGTALNADPRFPFYQIADEIEKVAAGEGKRIDSYLQLKTLDSDRIKGKILIDSPGFDADDQRNSVLRLCDHIIDLSDLVLIFFDARHPEPGAMHDTLHHLVSKAVKRADARKFLYILNQVDTTAGEDNFEAVFGAWQRSIAQAGLISGRFYGIYNKAAAVPISNPAQRARYESKCEADLAEIHGRIAEVEVGRGYRIVGMIDAIAKEVEGETIPLVEQTVARWRQTVLVGDALWLGIMAGVLGLLGFQLGPETLADAANWLMEGQGPTVLGMPLRMSVFLGVLLALFLSGHYYLRAAVAGRISLRLPDRLGHADLNPRNAFLLNTRFYRSLFRRTAVGWNRGARQRLFAIRETVALHVQRLNDIYTDPAGRRPPEVTEPAATTAPVRATGRVAEPDAAPGD